MALELKGREAGRVGGDIALLDKADDNIVGLVITDDAVAVASRYPVGTCGIDAIDRCNGCLGAKWAGVGPVGDCCEVLVG